MVQTTQVVVLPDGRMDPKNASTYCGLSVKTLAMKRCDGTGPRFVKLGRIFYFQEDLDAWLQRDRVVSTAQAQQQPSCIRQIDQRPAMTTPEALAGHRSAGSASLGIDPASPRRLKPNQ